MQTTHLHTAKYMFVNQTVRQQGNCALHILTHGMNINMSMYERTNDTRFSVHAMYDLRKSLLASFLEDKVWADQEERQIRLLNPEYRALPSDVIEISDDNVELIEHEQDEDHEQEQELEPVLDESWKLVKSIKELNRNGKNLDKKP